MFVYDKNKDTPLWIGFIFCYIVLTDPDWNKPNQHKCFSSRMAYYAVFDGHAGHRASQYAAEHLHRNIILKLPKGWW